MFQNYIKKLVQFDIYKYLYVKFNHLLTYGGRTLAE